MAIVIRKRAKKKKKADETFSHADLIRIFAFNLTKAEQRQVFAFFYIVLPSFQLMDGIRLFLLAKIPASRLSFIFKLSVSLPRAIDRVFDINIIKWLELLGIDLPLPLFLRIIRKLDKNFS